MKKNKTLILALLSIITFGCASHPNTETVSTKSNAITHGVEPSLASTFIGPKSEKEWKKTLSGQFPRGITRATAERKFNIEIVGEVDYDHGFAMARSVYYQLDESWVAVIAYQDVGPIGNSNPPAKMKLMIPPRLIPNAPGLIEKLSDASMPADRHRIETPNKILESNRETQKRNARNANFKLNP